MIPVPVTITAPSEEPLTLAQIKAHLRILTSSEDTHIGTLQLAARQHIENITGRVMMARTLEIYLPEFRDEMLLPRPPLSSVTSIKYLDTSNTLQTLNASTYVVEPASFFGSVQLAYGKQWPNTYVHPRAVTIRFVAGAATAAEVPEEFKHAIKLLTAHWYYNREPTLEKGQPLPHAIDALIQSHMTHGWI